MIVIAVANTKGGVGKTTITAALAVAAAGEGACVGVLDFDPQQSLSGWFERGETSDNLTVVAQAEYARSAVEQLDANDYDWLFIDSPPAFLTTVQDCIECADLVVIPLRPSMLDIISTQDAVLLAGDADTPFICVLNDVAPTERKGIEKSARDLLAKHKIPLAGTTLVHRASHVLGATVGKSAAEVNRGKDKKAAEEIGALWAEIKAAALRASAGQTCSSSATKPAKVAAHG